MSGTCFFWVAHLTRRTCRAVFASEYDDTANIWIGIITELRVQREAEDQGAEAGGQDKVWLKVKWGWSGKDLATLIKSL